MRRKLSEKELAGLKARIVCLMLGVEPVRDSFSGKKYFAANKPSYCEAFGMLQALDVLGFGKLRPKKETDFNLREWFDSLMDELANK